MNNNMNNKKYILSHGHRRFLALKKLQKKTIPCYDKITKKTLEVDINDILIIDNSRLESDSTADLQLMESIKERGLLQPLGVIKIDEDIFINNRLKDDKYIELMVDNISENENRKNIGAPELSNACKKLKDKGLNNKEIALFLNLSVTRIKNILSIGNNPSLKEEMDKVDFYGQAKRKSSKLCYSILSDINTMYVSNEWQNILLDYYNNNDVSLRKAKLINKFVRNGLHPNIAISKHENYKICYINVLINIDQFNIYKKKHSVENLKPSRILKLMLNNELPLDKKLFKI